MSRRFFVILMTIVLFISGMSLAEEAQEDAHKPVAILYTNDVHCGVESGVGYAGVSAYKKAYEKAGYDVILIDNGDYLQGESLGSFTRGDAIIDLMNAVGYDIAAIGNHEFDYGVDRLIELSGKVDFDIVCCNFFDANGECIFKPYVMRELGGYKIAFIGVETPTTMFTANPLFFENEQGEEIYSFANDGGGQELYDVVQQNVDAARAEGAQVVVAMCHLGDEYIDEGMDWTIGDLVTHTSGIDIALDAHAHHMFENNRVGNRDGVMIPTSSTGTKLQSLGVAFVNEDGEGHVVVTPGLHKETIFRDEAIEEKIRDVKAGFEDELQKIVAHTDFDLTIFDPVATDENGMPIRIVRAQETNLGDLTSDAYRVIGNADIGIVNGGAIRENIPAGDISFEEIISVHPFGNVLVVVEATGAQILDLLEAGASRLPLENGGFAHVSGMSYTIDMSVDSTVVFDEDGEFVGVDGARRVRDVMVGGEPIDPEGTYSVASHNFLLISGGDGMNMFKGDKILVDSGLPDNQVLIDYIADVLGGNIGGEYADPYGQGRINIING